MGQKFDAWRNPTRYGGIITGRTMERRYVKAANWQAFVSGKCHPELRGR